MKTNLDSDLAAQTANFAADILRSTEANRGLAPRSEPDREPDATPRTPLRKKSPDNPASGSKTKSQPPSQANNPAEHQERWNPNPGRGRKPKPSPYNQPLMEKLRDLDYMSIPRPYRRALNIYLEILSGNSAEPRTDMEARAVLRMQEASPPLSFQERRRIRRIKWGRVEGGRGVKAYTDSGPITISRAWCDLLERNEAFAPIERWNDREMQEIMDSLFPTQKGNSSFATSWARWMYNGGRYGHQLNIRPKPQSRRYERRPNTYRDPRTHALVHLPGCVLISRRGRELERLV